MLQFNVLIMLLAGMLLGIVFGSIPGLTATMGVALLTPLTFWMDPLAGIVMLIGIYVGAMFGDTLPAVLFRTPGTPAAIATTFDGYPLSEKGEAGRAIGICTLVSSYGGIVGAIILLLAAPQVAKFALRFGPPEYFSLAVFGLCIIAGVSGETILKGLLVGAFGLLVATVGLDPVLGFPRFWFSKSELLSGLSFIPIMIGVFGVGEILFKIYETLAMPRITQKLGIKEMIPSWCDVKRVAIPSGLAAIVGGIIGAIPGAGGDIAGLVAWDQARRISKHPEEFGKGSVEGLGAAESANNAVHGGALIPTLTLGVPGDAPTAIIIGALMMHGLRPGPLLFTAHRDFVFSVIAGLFLANLIGLPIIFAMRKAFVSMISLPRHFLWPMILFFCIIGSFAIHNSMFDVGVMFVFGIIGYFMRRWGYPPGPLVLGLILGPIAEANLRRSLIMSDGSYAILFTRPLSLILLTLAILLILGSVWQERRARHWKRRDIYEA